MASKDHSLDQPILDAARADFLEYGFEKASMRRIAERAGVTHGALYTRARSKDELFMMLISPLLSSIGEAFRSLKEEYFSKEDMTDPSSFLKTMRRENETILNVLFEDYDGSRLLLISSRGSSAENFFDGVIKEKIRETLEFFEGRGMESPDPGVLKMLIGSEFGTFRELIAEGYTLDHAKKILESVLTYHEAGWRGLLGI